MGDSNRTGTSPSPSKTNSPKPKYYIVAPGKTVTSLRGVLVAGEPVSAADFHAGEKALAALVKSKAVAEVKDEEEK